MGGGGGHSHSPLDVIDSLTTSQHKVVHFLSGFFTARFGSYFLHLTF